MILSELFIDFPLHLQILKLQCREKQQKSVNRTDSQLGEGFWQNCVNYKRNGKHNCKLLQLRSSVCVCVASRNFLSLSGILQPQVSQGSINECTVNSNRKVGGTTPNQEHSCFFFFQFSPNHHLKNEIHLIKTVTKTVWLMILILRSSSIKSSSPSFVPNIGHAKS